MRYVLALYSLARRLSSKYVTHLELLLIISVLCINQKQITMVRNYANFGLFLRDQFIQSGNISELENAAITEAKKHPKQYFFISSIIFDNFGEAMMGQKIISIYNDMTDIVLMAEI